VFYIDDGLKVTMILELTLTLNLGILGMFYNPQMKEEPMFLSLGKTRMKLHRVNVPPNLLHSTLQGKVWTGTGALIPYIS
jgi:hypothetical protein